MGVSKFQPFFSIDDGLQWKHFRLIESIPSLISREKKFPHKKFSNRMIYRLPAHIMKIMEFNGMENIAKIFDFIRDNLQFTCIVWDVDNGWLSKKMYIQYVEDLQIRSS